MRTLNSTDKKEKHKVILEVEALIHHYGINHALAGTLTLNGYYPPKDISKMFSKVMNRMRSTITAYYAVMDNSKPKTPHIHLIIIVPEDIRDGINLEVLRDIHVLQRMKRQGSLIPSDQARLESLRGRLGRNAALQRHRASLKRFKSLARFSPVFDLDPLYEAPEAIAAYMGKAYGNAASSRPRARAKGGYRVVYSSRKLPEGVKKPIWSFTPLTPKGSDYRNVLTAAASAYRIPQGDRDALMAYLGATRYSEISGAVFEFMNGVPRRPGRSYRGAAVKAHFDEKFPFRGTDHMVPLNAGTRAYQLR